MAFNEGNAPNAYIQPGLPLPSEQRVTDRDPTSEGHPVGRDKKGPRDDTQERAKPAGL